MKLRFFFVLLFYFSTIHAQTDAQIWSKVDKPTAGKTAESIGKYTSGCLRGASELPINGNGYQVMRLSRKRFYGHPDLIGFIEVLGQTAKAEKLGTLLVGDLGQPRGGPTVSGHKSHQTGLDVDIWYLLSDDAEKKELSSSERETWGAPSVVNPITESVKPAEWSSRNAKILEAAARMPEVDRIFVNAVIKKELCQSKTARDWLQKIRPWYKHDDHFHVRLKCPTSNRYCEKQEPVPAGDGCGGDLAWWFSYEAKHPTPKPPAPKIPLPKECTAVLYE